MRPSLLLIVGVGCITGYNCQRDILFSLAIMLRHLLFIIFFLSLGTIQSYSQHAEFLGIALGGEKESFVDSLVCKGYEVQSISETVTSLTGMFDGVQCIIEVHATPKTQTVHQVSVSFSEFMENEIARMLKYRRIRKFLKRKYSKWDYRRETALDEWSSDYARISLGTRRMSGQNYKTLYVWWQDRKGWERFNEELGE